VRPTGRGSPRRAAAAIASARERSWDSYRSIERYMEAGTCRRAQILDHFGDPEAPAPSGRCCDVCDPDEALARAVAQAPTRAAGTRRGRGSRSGSGAAAGAGAGSGVGARHDEDALGIPVDEREFEALRVWRLARSEGKPAYTVAPNAVLEEVLRVRPGNAGELIAIRGIGLTFCERHGESLLAELARLEAGAAQGAEVLPGVGQPG
jgi:ATP-dependent DNA helicase RecQ